MRRAASSTGCGFGVARRTARIGDDDTYLLVPMDHGVSAGPLPGLVDPAITAGAVARGGATGVIVHKGLVPRVAAEARVAGARGVSVGRNIWQSPDPAAVMAEVRERFATAATPLAAGR